MARYERDSDGVLDAWEVEVDDAVLWTREGRFWRRPDGSVAGGDLDWVSRPVRGLFRGIDKERARLIEKIVASGYSLVADVPMGVARDGALEARIADHPDDDALSVVYADWLQDHGDARGTWGAVVDGDAATAARLCAQAERDLRLHLGVDRGPRFGWRRGLLVWCSAEIAQLDNLRQHPLGATLTDARIRLTSTRKGMTVNVAEVAEVFPRGCKLRRLELADFVISDEAELSWVDLGDLGRLWPHLQELHTLVLQGGKMTLGQLDLPSLRSLDIRTTHLLPEHLDAIARPRPLLIRLNLWLGDNCQADLALLQRPDLFPSLRSLGLCNADVTSDLMQTLAKSPLLPQLSTLDLSRGTLSDPELEILLAHRRHFRHLAHLDLGQSCLSPAGIAAARQLCTSVTVTDQKTDRYVSVAE